MDPSWEGKPFWLKFAGKQLLFSAFVSLMKRSSEFAFADYCRCGANECQTHESVEQEYERVQLPDHIIPTGYELELDVRLDDHAFDGRVCISIEVRRSERPR